MDLQFLGARAKPAGSSLWAATQSATRVRFPALGPKGATKDERRHFITPFDLMILPSDSSRTGVGREIKFHVPIHPLLVWHPGCIRQVAELLEA